MKRLRGLLCVWAAAVALSYGVAVPADAQGTQYTTANVRLRAGAGTDARVLATIPRGAEVRVGECANRWCEVRFQGRSGYAARRYLSESRPTLRSTRPVRSSSGCGDGGGGYVNSRGKWVPSPCRSSSPPAGATAQCRDGTYSFSQSRRGTCSRHGGVARWL
jgi:uncharacterized protein YraI